MIIVLDSCINFSSHRGILTQASGIGCIWTLMCAINTPTVMISNASFGISSQPSQQTSSGNVRMVSTHGLCAWKRAHMRANETSSTRRHSQRLRKCQCRSGLARCGWAGCCASVCGNLEGMTQLSSTMARAATELCDHQLHNHCHKNKKECSSKQSLHCTRNKTMLNHAGRSNPFYPNLCRVAIQGYIAPFIKWPRQLLWIWILLCP